MASQAQWRYLFAADKPFAREWARETPGGKGRRYRRLRERVKATRITGNLYRANDGKFTAGSGGDSSGADKPAEGEPKKPSARQQNAAARRERAAAEAEARAAEADAEQATRDEEDAKLDAAKTPRERAKLRREIARARRERAAELRKARAERAAGERAKRGEEDAAATEEAAAPKPKDPKEAKPKKGGGGGGGKGEDPKKAEAAAERDAERAARRAEVEKRRAEADARRAAADARRAENDARRQAAEAERAERTQRELSDLATRAETPGMRLTDSQWQRLVVEGLAERDGAMIRLTEAGRQQARRRPQATKGLHVFKDARGRDRWVAISSTAYRDKDGEIVSCKALAQAVAQGDATGERGPLRWWHTPGVDLGDCDYQATAEGGRVLIESGTFRRPEYADALKARPGYQMSIGFVHPTGQPDAEGVFHDIAIFERSIVPPGRASNPFTSIATKERRMLTAEKDALLAELLGGRETEAYKAATAQAAATDKAAQQAGVAFKDAPPWAQALIGLLEEQGARLDALEATHKAAATEKAPMPPEEMIAAGETEAADGAEELAEDEGGDNLLSEAELDAIAERVAEKLMGRLDGIAQKMSEVDAELKGRGYQRMKEFAGDGLEKLTKTVAAIEATVKELNGAAPARGHRPSEDNPDLDALILAKLKARAEAEAPLDGVGSVASWLGQPVTAAG